MNWPLFIKSFLFLYLAFSAFAIGNGGFGGSTFVTFTTFVVTVAWIAWWAFSNPEGWSGKRNPWIQGWIAVLHGICAFVQVLVYVSDYWHEGIAGSSLEEMWQFWRPYFFYILATTVVVNVTLSLLVPRKEEEKWTLANDPEYQAIWRGEHMPRRDRGE